MTNVSSINTNQDIIYRQNQTQPKNTTVPENISKSENNLNSDKAKTNAKLVTDPYEELDKMSNEFISNCTDGIDDGKLSFGEKVKCFAKGFSDHFTEGFKAIKTLIKEHPKEALVAGLLTLGVGALAIATVGAPVLLAGISVLGIGLGAVGIVKDIKNIINSVKQAKNSTSDAEAKQAYSSIGNNTADLAQNAVEVYAGCKGLSSSVKILKEAKIAETGEEILNNVDDVIDRVLDDKLSSDEVDVIKESLSHTADLANNSMPLLQSLTGVSAFGIAAHPLKKTIN